MTATTCPLITNHSICEPDTVRLPGFPIMRRNSASARTPIMVYYPENRPFVFNKTWLVPTVPGMVQVRIER